MSKHSSHSESESRGRGSPSAAGSGDILLAVARQERQRAEIQAKLNTMLDSLRSSTAVTSRGQGTPPTVVAARVEPAAAVRARAIELFAEEATEAPVSAQRRQPFLEGPAAALKARLDNLVALENALAFRAELRRDDGEIAELPAIPAASEPLDAPSASTELAPVIAIAVPALPATADAEPKAAPAWQSEIDRLNERLERMEAASIMAATTLDSLVASFDTGQQNTFAAAQACAREEVRGVIAAEVNPALAELSVASSHAQEEIHGVLTLLGTCLERVVGHLQKIEGLSTGAAPFQDAEETLPFEPPAPAEDFQPAGALPAVEPPPLPTSAPAVPLPGFGRRSKLAALIDFGFGARAA